MMTYGRMKGLFEEHCLLSDWIQSSWLRSELLFLKWYLVNKMEFKLGTRWNSRASLLCGPHGAGWSMAWRWHRWLLCQVPAASQGGQGVRSTEERLHGKEPFSWTQGMGRSRWRRHAQRGSVAWSGQAQVRLRGLGGPLVGVQRGLSTCGRGDQRAQDSWRPGVLSESFRQGWRGPTRCPVHQVRRWEVGPVLSGFLSASVSVVGLAGHVCLVLTKFSLC